MKRASDGLVQSVTLYSRRRVWARLDVLPFALVYALLLPALLGGWGGGVGGVAWKVGLALHAMLCYAMLCWMCCDMLCWMCHAILCYAMMGQLFLSCSLHAIILLLHYSNQALIILISYLLFAMHLQSIALYAFPIPLLVHFALFLVSNGMPNLRCVLGHSIAATAQDADCVFVCAARNQGLDRVAAVRRGGEGEVTVFGRTYALPKRWFEFQKKAYDLTDSDPKTGTDTHTGTDTDTHTGFSRRQYPTRGSVRAMLSCLGHDEASAAMGRALWGENDFDIPLPAFLELYQEHLTAPFFLFQVGLETWRLGVL
jgi:hypothetical protein